MSTTPDSGVRSHRGGATVSRRAVWLRRSPRWLVLGVAIVALPKCIVCVVAYVAAAIAAGSVAVEWCGR